MKHLDTPCPRGVGVGARPVVWLAFALTTLAGASGLAAAGVPIAVSPGSGERFAVAGTPCPTFSWSAVEGAAAYELVVYPAPVAPRFEMPGADPVLQTRIPGGALAWTPSADDCLEIAGAYVWAVRAVGGGGAGDWSESRLFRVDPEAVLGELGPVLRRAIEGELRRRGAAAEAATAAAPAAGRAVSPAPAALPAAADTAGSAAPGPRGVFADDVELWLAESGSGTGDKVQLVFSTPQFDGDPSDAWAIIVDASATAAEPGKMFFSTPSFFDALQLFTDGSAILGEQREMKLRLRSAPPIACTSFLQEGLFYWDQDISALCVCDGSSWAPVDQDETGSCS